MSTSRQAGKGSKPRPVNKEKYNQNFDSIEGRGRMTGKVIKTSKGRTTYSY
jgi:hypothetical protein